MSEHSAYEIVNTPLGRIVVPPGVPAGVAIFWTTLDFDGSLDERSTTSILRVLNSLGAGSETFETCRQVHGRTVLEVSREEPGWSECSDCDALWARRPRHALAIKVADCLPISIIDHAASEVLIAGIHAGWRGAASGIVQEALRSIRESGHRFSDDARVYLGPSIRVCCFEVGEEVVDAFEETHSRLARFVDRSRSKPHVDLAGLTRETLIEEGFGPESIWDAGLCTRCPDSLFHSYRRSGPRAGRNLAVIGR